MESGIRFFSLAIVAKDKPINSLYVEASPIEAITSGDGEVKQNTVNTSTKDHTGAAISAVVDKSAMITAKWKPMSDSNRLTAPNVCAGETIILLKNNGSDEYFWITFGNDLDLRKKETVIYAVSNKTGKSDSWKSKVYNFVISTLDKFVLLHTDASDGELTTYDFYLDTKAGNFIFKDGFNNSFNLDSKNHEFNFNILKQFNIKTEKFSVTNSSGELIAILISLLDALIAEQHIDSMKGTTNLTPGSVAKYKAIKALLQTFKR